MPGRIYTQTWLLADLWTQEITYIEPFWQSEVEQKIKKHRDLKEIMDMWETCESHSNSSCPEG